MSECSHEEDAWYRGAWFARDSPHRTFFYCYHQFVILDTIDPDGPTAAARRALFDTLPPLDELLVQWTAKRNSIENSKFRCAEATVRCMAKLIPDTVVPVQAVVVRPPRDGFMTNDGTITVYVPHVTPPTCLKKPPVIITIPASCVRDEDGAVYNAFNTVTCAAGRTVLLMVSLAALATLTDGMTVANDGSVTLVPTVPLHLVPKVFSYAAKKNQHSDDSPQESDCSTTHYVEEE